MNKSVPDTDKYGNIRWYIKVEGGTRLHREDGAAVELVNGYRAWYLEGYCLYELSHYGEASSLTKIPKSLKQSIVIETLKLQADE